MLEVAAQNGTNTNAPVGKGRLLKNTTIFLGFVNMTFGLIVPNAHKSTLLIPITVCVIGIYKKGNLSIQIN